MRPLCTITAAILLLAAVSPAAAVELKYCNDITDPSARMDCLQDHISHLEQTLLTLGDQFTELSRTLDQKLGATDVYKLQSPTQNKCLGLSADNQGTALVPCDHPDAWKLLAGSQPPKLKNAGQSTSSGNSSASSGNASGNNGSSAHGNGSGGGAGQAGHKGTGAGGGGSGGQGKGGGKSQGKAASGNSGKSSTSDQGSGSSTAPKNAAPSQ